MEGGGGNFPSLHYWERFTPINQQDCRSHFHGIHGLSRPVLTADWSALPHHCCYALHAQGSSYPPSRSTSVAPEVAAAAAGAGPSPREASSGPLAHTTTTTANGGSHDEGLLPQEAEALQQRFQRDVGSSVGALAAVLQAGGLGGRASPAPLPAGGTGLQRVHQQNDSGAFARLPNAEPVALPVRGAAGAAASSSSVPAPLVLEAMQGLIAMQQSGSGDGAGGMSMEALAVRGIRGTREHFDGGGVVKGGRTFPRGAIALEGAWLSGAQTLMGVHAHACMCAAARRDLVPII